MSGPTARSYYDTPPDLASADGRIAVWLLDRAGPPALLTRTSAAAFDAKMARFLAQDADELLRRTTLEPVPIIHDFSSVRTYESAARQILTDWGKDLGKRMSSAHIHIGADAPRLVHMAVSVACAALTVLGRQVQPAPDLERTLRALGVRPRRR